MTPSRPRVAAMKLAQTTANAGLRNSDGWTETPATYSQRRAPFTSAPKNSVATVAAKAIRKNAKADRRTPCGDISEVTSITMIASGT